MTEDDFPNKAVREAYDMARAAITRWRVEGDKSVMLNFSGRRGFRALDRLPIEISNLTSLQGLSLYNTNIRDIRVLSALKELQTLVIDATAVNDIIAVAELHNLQSLWLSNTDVEDLSSLKHLRRMAEITQDTAFVWKDWHGLDFNNCPNLSPRLQEIATLKHARERTLQALNYIRAEAGLSSVEDWVREPSPESLDEQSSVPLPDVNSSAYIRSDFESRQIVGARLFQNRAILALLIADLESELATAFEVFRGDNHISEEDRASVKNLFDELSAQLQDLKTMLAETTSSMAAEAVADKALNWRDRFLETLTSEGSRYIHPERVGSVVLPAGIILSCGAIGGLLGAPLAGVAVGAFLTNRMSATDMAKEIFKTD